MDGPLGHLDSLITGLGWLACAAVAFTLGPALGARELRAPAGLAGAALSCLAFGLLIKALPFWGPTTEALAVVAGGVVLAWPVSAVVRMPRGAVWRDAPRPLLLLAALWLPLGAFVMNALIDRLNYAQRLRWTCDGPILERTRVKSNHNVPALIVARAGGSRRFEMVDGPLWQRALPGQRLVKRAGTAFAQLDGQAVRMVPAARWRWWSDPDAPRRP